MKIVKLVAGLLVALVVLAVVGVQVMKGKALDRLEQKWDGVKGVDVPVPWPLSASEIEVLRAQKAQELAAARAAAGSAGAGEAAPVTPPDADPLAGVDLTALAKERALERGKHLLEARVGCGDCHGADYGGKVIIEAAPMGVWAAPNISMGGAGKLLKPADWDRIVRHGIARDGTSTTMPAIDFMALSDQELSDIITVITSMPPVDRPDVENVMGPLRGVLIATGAIPISAEQIDHARPRPKVPPAAEVNAEFGKHVVASCVGCHRLNLAGGPIPGGDPSWPEASNLTPDASGLKGWTADEFKAAMRQGKGKGGRELQEPMKSIAVNALSKLSDTELDAAFLYLQSLAPLAKGAEAP